ncbi:MAG: SdrD B-like domain-containing protein, partial [Limisphaerales bacterium]
MKPKSPSSKQCPSFRLGALLLALAAWLVPASASHGIADTSCCIALPPIPANEADGLVAGSFGAPYGAGNPPDYSFFTVDIQPGGPQTPTPPIPAGRYPAWCFDRETGINAGGAGTLFGGYLHSSCDPNLNQYLPSHPNVAHSPETWNKINYLINHRTEACGGLVPTMWEFQTAIFVLLGQGAEPTPPFPPYRQAVIDCLIASANANGPTWSPQCGDKMAVIYNIDINWDNAFPEVQLIFLEVPCPCTSLGDYVWLDDNANGIQDEPASNGVNGVQVNLLDCSGAPVLDGANQPVTTTTANDVNGNPGYYLFRNLLPGCYRVEFELPAGHAFTTQNAPGSTGANGSDPDPVTGITGDIPIAYGDHDLNWDAGLIRPASIGNFVWEDNDLNGQQDGGEPGIPGATVSLTDCSGAAVTDINGNPVNSVVTGVDGAYSFVNLKPGTYQVTFVLPSGYTFTQAFNGPTATDSNANPADGKSDCRTLVAGQNDDTVDAGAYRPASIGNFVWEDNDLDGQQGGSEPGIPG